MSGKTQKRMESLVREKQRAAVRFNLGALSYQKDGSIFLNVGHSWDKRVLSQNHKWFDLIEVSEKRWRRQVILERLYDLFRDAKSRHEIIRTLLGAPPYPGGSDISNILLPGVRKLVGQYAIIPSQWNDVFKESENA